VKRDATLFAKDNLSEGDEDRIALWGSSSGGGLVTTMPALDSRVKCVAARVAAPREPSLPHWICTQSRPVARSSRFPSRLAE
jgi:cephalosporin-C deacetylase-like acetyl esterase